MSRRLRWIEPNSLTEITDRCFQGRFLLRPSPQLNRLIIGVFAQAKEFYPVELHSLAAMSNHMHFQVTPGGREVRALKTAVGLDRSAVLIVSHNVREDILHLDFGGIKNHHLVHCAGRGHFSVFLRVDGHLGPQACRHEPLLEQLGSS